MKLMLFLSHNGILSRRKAFEAIKNGAVAVNGRVNLEPSTDVDPARDKVHFHARLVNDRIFEYIMLNKPEGYVTTCEKQFGQETVLDLLPKELKHLRPVGRLDKDTEGLLLFTNDGELANQLAHPSFDVDKTYLVRVRGKITPDEVRSLEAGVVIDDKKTAPSVVALIRAGDDNSEFQITIHEGRKHQVRLMCDAVAHPVVYLSRLSQGPLELGSLPRGEYRRLSEEEAMVLKRIKRAGAPGARKAEVKEVVAEPKYVGRRGRGEFNRDQRLRREESSRERDRVSGARDERPRSYAPREGRPGSTSREGRPAGARPVVRTRGARDERPRAYVPREGRPQDARRPYVPKESARSEAPRRESSRPEMSSRDNQRHSVRDERPRAHGAREGKPQDPRRRPYVPKEGGRAPRSEYPARDGQQSRREERPRSSFTPREGGRPAGRPEDAGRRAPRPVYSSREGHRSVPRAGERPAAAGLKPLFSSHSEKRRSSTTREWHSDSDVHAPKHAPSASKPFHKKPFTRA